MPKTSFKINFDASSPGKDSIFVRYDVFTNHVNSTVFSGHLDIRAWQFELLWNRFDSFRFGDVPIIFANRFNASPYLVTSLYNRWNIYTKHNNIGQFCGMFNAVVLQNTFFSNRWDSINTTTAAQLAFRYDIAWAYLWRISNRFQIISDSIARICYGRHPSRFNIEKPANNFYPIRFDIIPQDFATHFRNRFDVVGTGYFLLPARKQSFVKPGWSILAKNIVSGEIQNLGFINAESENHTLENIFLPDGDYEISVLTSSLFWKDTFDRTIRQLAVRPDAEVSPLPTIFNLRSSISQGETTIHWSAGPSDVPDCVFGVWYSSTTPVSIDRPSDTTVWYSPEMTEYQTSFKQTAPCYAAVAVIRTGDEPESGPVKELFLDWKSIPPRAPDDVVVFDKPLPVFDPKITTQQDNNPDITLWSNQF